MRVDESTGSGWTCEANGCIVCRGGTCASGQGAKGYGTERCFGAVYGSGGSGGGASYGYGTTTSGNSSGITAVDRSAEIAAQQEATRQATAREEAARQAFLQGELRKLQTAKEFDVQLQPDETGLSPEGLWTLGQYDSKRTIIPPGAPCNFNLFNYVEQRWWQYMCGPNTWAKFGHDGLPYYKIRQVFAAPVTSQPTQPKPQPTTATRVVQSGANGQPSGQYANDDQGSQNQVGDQQTPTSDDESGGSLWLIFLALLIMTGVVFYFYRRFGRSRPKSNKIHGSDAAELADDDLDLADTSDQPD